MKLNVLQSVSAVMKFSEKSLTYLDFFCLSQLPLSTSPLHLIVPVPSCRKGRPWKLQGRPHNQRCLQNFTPIAHYLNEVLWHAFSSGWKIKVKVSCTLWLLNEGRSILNIFVLFNLLCCSLCCVLLLFLLSHHSPLFFIFSNSCQCSASAWLGRSSVLQAEIQAAF